MPKIIKKGNTGLTIASNKVIRDSFLTWEARGVFMYLWSQSDTWTYRAKEVATHSPQGIDKLNACLKELEAHGYLKRKRNRDGGMFKDSVWILSDSPMLDFPIQAKPKQAEPIQANPILRNTNIKKHQLEETLNKRKSSPAKAEPDYEQEFVELWESYPKGKKQGKQLALRSYTNWRKTSKVNTFDKAKLQLNKYLNYIKVQQVQTQYIKAAKTWFGNIDDEYDQSPASVKSSYGMQNKRVEKGTDWSKQKPIAKSDVNPEKLKNFFEKFESQNNMT